MKIETITNGGHSSFTTECTVYVDLSVGESKRSLRILSDGRIFDETDPEKEIEI